MNEWRIKRHEKSKGKITISRHRHGERQRQKGRAILIKKAMGHNMSRRFSKRKEDKSSNPSGPVTKPPADTKEPIRLRDDTRVIYAEETNRDDG